MLAMGTGTRHLTSISNDETDDASGIDCAFSTHHTKSNKKNATAIETATRADNAVQSILHLVLLFATVMCIDVGYQAQTKGEMWNLLGTKHHSRCWYGNVCRSLTV